MKKNLLLLSALIAFTAPSQASAKPRHTDTLVDVGGYKLHFTIIPGSGTPILFESGLGDDGSVWDSILNPVYKVTGTTLITYDRAGYGRSEVNLKEPYDTNHGIISGMEALETALKKLGYDGNLILVCHSFGGFFTSLYASRHPSKVKYIVRLDASLTDFYTDDFFKNYFSDSVEKADGPGLYYEKKNFRNTVNIIRQVKFPSTVPVIDIVAGIQNQLEKEWNKSHKNFVSAQPNRTGIIASGCEHDIIADNPSLVISAIINAYSETLNEEQRCAMLNKILTNSIDGANDTRKNERAYHLSENNLNDLGYSLMGEKKMEKALEVFKLNILLFPESWNVYDSYAEALLVADNRTEAIKMYKKSLEINPNNKNAEKMLQKLKSN